MQEQAGERLQLEAQRVALGQHRAEPGGGAQPVEAEGGEAELPRRLRVEVAQQLWQLGNHVCKIKKAKKYLLMTALEVRMNGQKCEEIRAPPL